MGISEQVRLKGEDLQRIADSAMELANTAIDENRFLAANALYQLGHAAYMVLELADHDLLGVVCEECAATREGERPGLKLALVTDPPPGGPKAG